MRRIVPTAVLALAAAAAIALPATASTQAAPSIAPSAATAACGGAVTSGLGFWIEQASNCGYIGGRPDSTITYTLKATSWSSTGGAEAQVLAYRNGSPYWVNAGFYKPGDVYTITVPWGNVGATPKVRARTPAGFGVLSISFTH
ncbi:hypothetical protein AB0F30_27650 [Streptomyces sp. NPDC029006]|uniref:hypothetical protein n=1 Tax=Streptomyces sp. NPDC029006 TaxID=3155467 RepID=UPI0033D7CDA6